MKAVGRDAVHAAKGVSGVVLKIKVGYTRAGSNVDDAL